MIHVETLSCSDLQRPDFHDQFLSDMSSEKYPGYHQVLLIKISSVVTLLQVIEESK